MDTFLFGTFKLSAMGPSAMRSAADKYITVGGELGQTQMTEVFAKVSSRRS